MSAVDDIWDNVGSLEFMELEEESIYNMQNKEKSFVFERLNDKWETIDGTIMELRDMDINHLSNSIKMIERGCRKKRISPNTITIYSKLHDELSRKFSNLAMR